MNYRLPFNKAQLRSLFGMRTITVGGKTSTEFHKGQDWVIGDKKILATETGKVIVSGINGGYGECIMIQHSDGLVSVYGHMSKRLVSVGQEVARGQQIGVEGSTGRSTGSHLHFEFRPNRWDRSQDVKHNPATVIGFKEAKHRVYKFEEESKPTQKPQSIKPEWQVIIESKVDSPKMWIDFVNEMKTHEIGKYLPELIVKVSKGGSVNSFARWVEFIEEMETHPTGKWLPLLFTKIEK